MSELKVQCEACHTRYPESEGRGINTTNGHLNLCKLCLEDVNRKNPELIALRNKLGTLCGDHLRLAGVYEQGGNVAGSIQLRAVANMLGVLIQGGEPTTVLPDPDGHYGDAIRGAQGCTVSVV